MKTVEEINNDIKVLKINLRIFKYFISNVNLKSDFFEMEVSYYENGNLKSDKFNFTRDELLEFPNLIRNKINNLNLLKNNFTNININ